MERRRVVHYARSGVARVLSPTSAKRPPPSSSASPSPSSSTAPSILGFTLAPLASFESDVYIFTKQRTEKGDVGNPATNRTSQTKDSDARRRIETNRQVNTPGIPNRDSGRYEPQIRSETKGGRSQRYGREHGKDEAIHENSTFDHEVDSAMQKVTQGSDWKHSYYGVPTSPTLTIPPSIPRGKTSPTKQNVGSAVNTDHRALSPLWNEEHGKKGCQNDNASGPSNDNNSGRLLAGHPSIHKPNGMCENESTRDRSLSSVTSQSSVFQDSLSALCPNVQNYPTFPSRFKKQEFQRRLSSSPHSENSSDRHDLNHIDSVHSLNQSGTYPDSGYSTMQREVSQSDKSPSDNCLTLIQSPRRSQTMSPSCEGVQNLPAPDSHQGVSSHARSSNCQNHETRSSGKSLISSPEMKSSGHREVFMYPNSTWGHGAPVRSHKALIAGAYSFSVTNEHTVMKNTLKDIVSRESASPNTPNTWCQNHPDNEVSYLSHSSAMFCEKRQTSGQGDDSSHLDPSRSSFRPAVQCLYERQDDSTSAKSHWKRNSMLLATQGLSIMPDLCDSVQVLNLESPRKDDESISDQDSFKSAEDSGTELQRGFALSAYPSAQRQCSSDNNSNISDNGKQQEHERTQLSARASNITQINKSETLASGSYNGSGNLDPRTTQVDNAIKRYSFKLATTFSSITDLTILDKDRSDEAIYSEEETDFVSELGQMKLSAQNSSAHKPGSKNMSVSSQYSNCEMVDNDEQTNRIKRRSFMLATSSLSDLTCAIDEVDAVMNSACSSKTNPDLSINEEFHTPESHRKRPRGNSSCEGSRLNSSFGSFYSCQSFDFKPSPLMPPRNVYNQVRYSSCEPRQVCAVRSSPHARQDSDGSASGDTSVYYTASSASSPTTASISSGTSRSKQSPSIQWWRRSNIRPQMSPARNVNFTPMQRTGSLLVQSMPFRQSPGHMSRSNERAANTTHPGKQNGSSNDQQQSRGRRHSSSSPKLSKASVIGWCGGRSRSNSTPASKIPQRQQSNSPSHAYGDGPHGSDHSRRPAQSSAMPVHAREMMISTAAGHYTLPLDLKKTSRNKFVASNGRFSSLPASNRKRNSLPGNSRGFPLQTDRYSRDRFSSDTSGCPRMPPQEYSRSRFVSDCQGPPQYRQAYASIESASSNSSRSSSPEPETSWHHMPRSPPSLGRPRRKMYAGFDCQPLPMDNFLSDSSSVYSVGMSWSSRATSRSAEVDSSCRGSGLSDKLASNIRAVSAGTPGAATPTRRMSRDSVYYDFYHYDDKQGEYYGNDACKGSKYSWDQLNPSGDNKTLSNRTLNLSTSTDTSYQRFEDIDNDEDVLTPQTEQCPPWNIEEKDSNASRQGAGSSAGNARHSNGRAGKQRPVLRSKLSHSTDFVSRECHSDRGRPLKAASSAGVPRPQCLPKKRHFSSRDLLDLIMTSEQDPVSGSTSLTSLETEAQNVCRAILCCNEMHPAMTMKEYNF